MFGYQRAPKPEGSATSLLGGAETTDKVLNAVLEAGVGHKLTLMARLSAVNADGTKTEFAATSGSTADTDTSEGGQVIYRANSVSLLGQRIDSSNAGRSHQRANNHIPELSLAEKPCL